jgi:hypothetical protein
VTVEREEAVIEPAKPPPKYGPEVGISLSSTFKVLHTYSSNKQWLGRRKLLWPILYILCRKIIFSSEPPRHLQIFCCSLGLVATKIHWLHFNHTITQKSNFTFIYFPYWHYLIPNITPVYNSTYTTTNFCRKTMHHGNDLYCSRQSALRPRRIWN